MSTPNLLSDSYNPQTSWSRSDIGSFRRSLSENLSCHAEDYRGLVLSFKTERPDYYQNSLEELQRLFSLSEEDMAGYDHAFYILLSSANPMSDFCGLLVTDKKLMPLLRRSIAKAAFGLTGESFDEEADEKAVDDFLADVRLKMDSSFSTMEDLIHSIQIKGKIAASKMGEGAIRTKRGEALENMNENHRDFFDGLEEIGPVLDDDQMNAIFRATREDGPQFLSTNFDTAQFGIENRALSQASDRVARLDAPDWGNFVRRMRRNVTFPLEFLRNFTARRRFHPENTTFHPNGSMAFSSLVSSCIEAGSRVLATDEEYKKMLDKERKINVEYLVKPFADVTEYRGQIEEILQLRRFDYMIVSEVSRFGTVFPLNQIHAVRRGIPEDRRPRLIVDACQSAGRIAHHLSSSQPDAVFYTTNKGGEFGESLGVVSLADDFAEQINRARIADTAKDLDDYYPGTQSHLAMARTAHAMQLADLTIPRESSGLALEPAERGRIIRPHNKEHLAHVLEVKVEGVTRKRLSEFAKECGVHISASYDNPHDDESFRVAFHPYMGNDSLKLLGWVLEHVTQKPKS